MAYFGPENEFFIFDNVIIKDGINESFYKLESDEGEWSDDAQYEDTINTGHRPRTKGGYFPVMPTDSTVDMRAEMVQVLQEIGLDVVLHHHEVAQAQAEIGVKFGNLLEAADNVQKYKYVVRMIAHLNGKQLHLCQSLSIMIMGIGMHVHQIYLEKWKNLFYKKVNMQI